MKPKCCVGRTLLTSFVNSTNLNSCHVRQFSNDRQNPAAQLFGSE